MNLTIGDLLAVKHTCAQNLERLRTRRFRAVTTDSRTVGKGDLFVALRGDRFDGNAFTSEAFRRGAAAAVVDTPKGRRAAGRHPVIVVRNSTRALGDLSRIYRSKFNLPVIAVAGSNGKTTTKDLIAAALKKKYRVLATAGNFNNQVGVPLTLFRLRKNHEVAVVELGTNHFGEIRCLAGITLPTHGLITNIGREHLGYFRDLAGVAKAEGELIDFLETTGGTAFLNMDDPRLARRAGRPKSVVRYGFTRKAREVKASALQIAPDGCPRFTVTRRGRRGFSVRMSVPGKQSAGNGVAAAAVALSFGVPALKIRAAVENFRPTGKRMEVLKKGGVVILNDTYNANPESVASALETLALISVRGKKIVVLADMLEMGNRARREHERVGRLVRSGGFAHLLTFGPKAKDINRAAGTGTHFRTKRELSRALHAVVGRGDALLVKGSRGMKMEEIVDSLLVYLRRAA